MESSQSNSSRYRIDRSSGVKAAEEYLRRKYVEREGARLIAQHVEMATGGMWKMFLFGAVASFLFCISSRALLASLGDVLGIGPTTYGACDTPLLFFASVVVGRKVIQAEESVSIVVEEGEDE